MHIAVILLISSTSIFASQKKGFGLCGAKYRCGDTYALSTSSWWQVAIAGLKYYKKSQSFATQLQVYNWHPTPEENLNHKCAKKTRGEFVPMVHGEHDVGSFNHPNDAKHILGFNEPNVWRNGEFEFSPESAAELWPQIEQKAHGKILVSPAPTSCDNFPNSCFSWFDRFFKACHNCRVDRLALHAYNCQPNQIMDMIDKFYHKYNKKIWLTEFACYHAKNADDNVNFLKQILPRLESSPYVEKYAWFCTREKPGYSHENWNLWNQDSPSLSKVGQYYNSH